MSCVVLLSSVHHNTPGARSLHQLDPPLALSRPLHRKRQQQQRVLISRPSVARSNRRLTRPPPAHHLPIPVLVSVVTVLTLRRHHWRLVLHS